MAIPVNHNAEDNLDDDFNEFLEGFDEIIVDDDLKYIMSPESLSDESGSGFGFEFDSPRPKRKASDFNEFYPFDFSSNADEEDKFEVPEFPDWYNIINFEQEFTQEGTPVSCPTSNPAEASGSGKPPLPKRKTNNCGSGAKNSVEVGKGIVLALMAPQVCPWRTSKGGIKKGRTIPIKIPNNR
uniref:Uncharacterized protein n=1 Tax=Opuntia streptacantha TaxID=393608 RepID=A0A7C8YUE2_OPUST